MHFRVHGLCGVINEITVDKNAQFDLRILYICSRYLYKYRLWL